MTTLARNQFETIATIAKERWGLHLTERKIALVTNRLSKFLLRAPYADVESYLEHLETNATEEDMLMFFDLLSTNTTSFFREINHFHYLERALYTPLARRTLTLPGRRLRIWSAACSTGAEPYSMGIHALTHFPDLESWDFRILATDLSNTALDKARAAVYPEDMVAAVDDDLVRQFFLRGKGELNGKVRVADRVRRLVSVRQLNLMDRWPMTGPFDVIFCRNVMIYFDAATREQLVNRMYQMLRPGGILAIGSAETLSGLDTPFQGVEPSVYLRSVEGHQ